MQAFRCILRQSAFSLNYAAILPYGSFLASSREHLAAMVHGQSQEACLGPPGARRGSGIARGMRHQAQDLGGGDEKAPSMTGPFFAGRCERPGRIPQIFLASSTARPM